MWLSLTKLHVQHQETDRKEDWQRYRTLCATSRDWQERGLTDVPHFMCYIERLTGKRTDRRTTLYLYVLHKFTTLLTNFIYLLCNSSHSWLSATSTPTPIPAVLFLDNEHSGAGSPSLLHDTVRRWIYSDFKRQCTRWHHPQLSVWPQLQRSRAVAVWTLHTNRTGSSVAGRRNSALRLARDIHHQLTTKSARHRASEKCRRCNDQVLNTHAHNVQCTYQ